jgi:hypothetical protein
MRKTQITATALSLSIVVALLAGCTTADPTPTNTPTGAEPTATPTPTVDPVEVPEQLFDDDCDAMMTSADVSVDVGATLTPVTSAYDLSTDYVAVEQLGGIRCVWSASSEPDDLWVSIVALPSEVIEPPTEVGPCESAEYCYFGTITSGVQLFGVVIDPAGVATAAAPALTARFTDAAASVTLPSVVEASGTWPRPAVCSSLDSQGVVATALGDPSIVGSEAGGDGETNPGVYTAFRAAGVSWCVWSSSATGVFVSVLPGAAWIEDEIAAVDGTTAIELDGADSAYLVGKSVHVFAGPNWLTFVVPDDSPLQIADFYAGITGIVADLDAQAS